MLKGGAFKKGVVRIIFRDGIGIIDFSENESCYCQLQSLDHKGRDLILDRNNNIVFGKKILPEADTGEAVVCWYVNGFVEFWTTPEIHQAILCS
jgi:hypothetical protein